MTFPSTLTPSARQYTPGGWPVGTSKMIDGYETRMLFGSKRTGSTLALTYSNITDDQVSLFIEHYKAMKGVFLSFVIEPSSGAYKGWTGSSELDVGGSHEWRYNSTPQVTNVMPGISNLSLDLIGVLV